MTMAEALQASRTIWVLVEENGQGRLAVPASMPPGALDLRSLQGRDSLGRYPVSALAALVRDFQRAARSQSGDWQLLVSVPGSTPDRQSVLRSLSEPGARPATPEEAEAIRSSGMEIPLGQWADPLSATILVLE